MAITKVLVDSLVLLRQTMKQAWDDIVDIKLEVDHYCYNFEWDDPVGRSFIAKYEEGMAPIKEKLLPMLEKYGEYLDGLTMNVDEYSGGTSHIHISGGETIERVIPKGTPTDPIVLDPNATVRIPNDTLQPLESEFVFPTTEEFGGTWELQPGEQITLENDIVVEVSPIANGCGTEKGFGHWAGQTGAGIDAFMNSFEAPDAVKDVAFIGVASVGGVGGLIALSKAGEVLNPDEFRRLNDEACAMHDICYVEGDKFVCEENLRRDGGRIMSTFTSLFGGGAYKDAQKLGKDSKTFISKAQMMSGKKIILPEGWFLKLKK